MEDDFLDMDVSLFRSASAAGHAKKKVEEKAVTMSTASSLPAWKIEKMVDGETSKKPILLTSREDARRIVEARVANKLSQKELAAKLALPLPLIKDIEAGKAVENRNHLVKIFKFFNLKAT
jgi:ribosome-binding protein aMBF1 (putative translation factor)